uniref:Terpene synthase 5 n=1 Tax=Chiococca alba TaxID=28527 RepID=A0A6M3EV86_CHIAL|nr:terpene synthase 5 [Chiococca alba]
MIHTLPHGGQAHFISHKTQPYYSSRPRFSSAASLDTRVRRTSPSNSSVLDFNETKERITKLFHNVDYSISSYDTAWVAMVPDPHSSQAPLFPECINWLLDNQFHDGSWSLPHHNSLLLKDVLSSTLACVLALKRWGIGGRQIDKGVRFIEMNFGSASDNCQHTPIGFDIIFPGMLENARDLDLNLRLEPRIVTDMQRKRDMQLTRLHESDLKGDQAYLAYVSEGMQKLQNWDLAMKFQRKNGSLFNSPSATAAAVMHVQNPASLNYLHSVVDKFGHAVPAVYPLDLYARLCLVDNLERLGICRHFTNEIEIVMEDTYRCWLQDDEDIFAEISTCALAFRLLRKHGYVVSPDPLTKIIEEEDVSNSSGNGYWNDIHAVMEVHRASEVVIHENESDLKNQNTISKHLLRHHLFNGSDVKPFPNPIYKQVDYALKFPTPLILQRVENKTLIQNYDVDSTRLLKTSYRSSNFCNEDLLRLAVKDFNDCQLLHRKELKELERWSADNRLHELKFARQKAIYCSFSAAATIFIPEWYEARMSLAKNSVLATVVDDFFDVGGSMEELKKLIEFVEKWDIDITKESCSEPLKIIFSALHSTISEIGEQAVKWQGRNVTSHIIEIWLDLLNSMLRESEWTTDVHMPTLDEYMEAAYVSFAMGPIIIPALYFVGPKLSDEIVRDPEIRSLHKLVSICGRLLNDMQGFEREKKAGKPNAVSIRISQNGDGITESAAFEEVKMELEDARRELLRLVVQKDGSVVPRACKDAFWSVSRMLHHFYFNNDGYTSEVEMVELVNSIIHEPLK